MKPLKRAAIIAIVAIILLWAVFGTVQGVALYNNSSTSFPWWSGFVIGAYLAVPAIIVLGVIFVWAAHREKDTSKKPKP